MHSDNLRNNLIIGNSIFDAERIKKGTLGANSADKYMSRKGHFWKVTVMFHTMDTENLPLEYSNSDSVISKWDQSRPGWLSARENDIESLCFMIKMFA